MGVWGFGPFENDTAADFVAGLQDPVMKVFKMKSDKRARYHYEKARAAAQFLLLSHGTDILGGAPLVLILHLLRRMRLDSEYLSSFRRPKKMAAALNAELNDVVSRINTCKVCRKSIGKAGVHNLGVIAAKACARAVPPSNWPKRRLPARKTKRRHPPYYRRR